MTIYSLLASRLGAPHRRCPIYIVTRVSPSLSLKYLNTTENRSSPFAATCGRARLLACKMSESARVLKRAWTPKGLAGPGGPAAVAATPAAAPPNPAGSWRAGRTGLVFASDSDRDRYTYGSMTTFLGVWHQSLGVTSKWLRGRRGVRGGDSRLHCAVLPVVPLAGGRGSGYVARPPRKRAKTRQKPRTAPRCSVVSPCTGRNRASLRRSSEPLQASQARATLRRPAAPEDQSRRPRRTRLLPQERPRAEEAEVDVKMTPLSAETVRGS